MSATWAEYTVFSSDTLLVGAMDHGSLMVMEIFFVGPSFSISNSGTAPMRRPIVNYGVRPNNL